ncbi:sensor histidine kinase [Microbacteriaceae bacterium VKM Ac-2855]|nr:sensor histidine kinase [Microbacteriaceae bacterium VKM Ac-2855]
MRFATRVLVLQLATVLAVLSVCVAVFLAFGVDRLREEAQGTALAIARTLAEDPDVRAQVAEVAAQDPAPSGALLRDTALARHAATVGERTGALFVVITDEEGIRLAHPDPERIGEPVSTSPDAALRGEEVVSWETGTLGESARAKVPVTAPDGSAVVGEVSIGFARSSVFANTPDVVAAVLAAAGLALALGVIASVLLRRHLARLTLGLQPEQLRALVQDQAAVLDGVGEGVFALGRDGRVTVCNAPAVELLGLSDPVGRRWSELGLPHPLADALAQQMRSGAESEPVTAVVGERIVFVEVRPVQHGAIDLGAVVIVRDRTDVAALTRRLDAVETMSRAMRVQRHEFANRLHVVEGMLAAQRVDDARGYLAEVLARGPLKYPVQHADRLAEPYLQAFVGAKGIEAAERGVLLTLGEETLVRGVVTDPEDVATVLGNLVDNAIRAAVLSGREPAWVELELLDDGTELYLTVADSGDGVVDPVALFDRSGRAEGGADQVHGLGFGLPLSRDIARRRGGDLWLADAGGGEHGAVLCARLPGVVLPAEVVR